MVELVQQHHPEMGVQEIVKMLNRASDDYCSRTRLLDAATTFDTVMHPTTGKGQRYYGLSTQILQIWAVDLENDDGDLAAIPRLIGRPPVRDIV